MRGRVKWFDSKRGYGFAVAESDGSEVVIERDGAERDIFCHRNEIQSDRELSDGDRIEFELWENERGLFARNIKPVQLN